MSLRTPLGRVLGLGAAKDGVAHWWTQRLTAVALVPLGIWFLVSLLTLGSLEYDIVHAWLEAPLHAVAALLWILCLAYHSQLGVQVVVEDYVHHPGIKLVTLILIKFAHIAAAGIGVFAVLKVAFGGGA